jgi:hypothetical protein
LDEDEECPAKSSLAPLAKKVAHLGHQARVPSATSCTTFAQADERKAHLQCVIPPSCGRCTCNFPCVECGHTLAPEGWVCEVLRGPALWWRGRRPGVVPCTPQRLAWWVASVQMLEWWRARFLCETCRGAGDWLVTVVYCCYGCACAPSALDVFHLNSGRIEGGVELFAYALGRRHWTCVIECMLLLCVESLPGASGGINGDKCVGTLWPRRVVSVRSRESLPCCGKGVDLRLRGAPAGLWWL